MHSMGQESWISQHLKMMRGLRSKGDPDAGVYAKCHARTLGAVNAVDNANKAMESLVVRGVTSKGRPIDEKSGMCATVTGIAIIGPEAMPASQWRENRSVPVFSAKLEQHAVASGLTIRRARTGHDLLVALQDEATEAVLCVEPEHMSAILPIAKLFVDHPDDKTMIISHFATSQTVRNLVPEGADMYAAGIIVDTSRTPSLIDQSELKPVIGEAFLPIGRDTAQVAILSRQDREQVRAIHARVDVHGKYANPQPKPSRLQIQIHTPEQRVGITSDKQEVFVSSNTLSPPTTFLSDEGGAERSGYVPDMPIPLHEDIFGSGDEKIVGCFIPSPPAFTEHGYYGMYEEVRFTPIWLHEVPVVVESQDLR